MTKRNENGRSPTSGYYFYTKPWDGSPPYCQKPGDTTHNQMCGHGNAIGDHCCPAPPNGDSGFRGGPLSCCDIDNFIIDKVSRRWILTDDVDPDTPAKNFTHSKNVTLTSLTARWLRWVDADKPPDCSNPPADTPVIAGDKVTLLRGLRPHREFHLPGVRGQGRDAGRPQDGKAEWMHHAGVAARRVQAMHRLVDHRLQHPVGLRPDEVHRRSPASEHAASARVRRREAAQRERPGPDARPALHGLRSPGGVRAVPEPGRQQVPTRRSASSPAPRPRRQGVALRQVPAFLGEVRQRVQPQSVHAVRPQPRRRAWRRRARTRSRSTISTATSAARERA